MEKSIEISLDSAHLKKISIPSTEFADNYVVYNIEVSLYDYSWTVKRRYREFLELHEKLLKQFPSVGNVTFPPKKLFGNFDPCHVEKRRQDLQAYLQNIVTELGKFPRPLQIFLEFHIYDVLAVTQTLAEELFEIGDRFLANEETFVVTPLQLYCISKRLKLPIPTCGGEDYLYDVGNLYDIVYYVQSVKIVKDEKHNLNNFSEEDISFDLSLFKNLKTLQISKCNIELLQGTFHLQENLKKLSVHKSLRLLKDILIDHDVWTYNSCEDILKQGSCAVMTWKQLTVLDFSHNEIPYIDESVTLLHELVTLDLSYNKIQDIAHLQDLPNLRELNLSFNEIESLDAVNMKLGNITTLRLAGNKLSNVGDISKMFSLVNLDLSENHLNDISDVVSLAELPCLENLILLANPVRHKSMYRTELLLAFENRVSQICLDKVIPTEAEIKKVMQILAEEDTYEFVNMPDTLESPRKNKTGQKKAGRRMKIKSQDVLDGSMKASSLSVNKIKSSDEEQEFRDRVEKIRRLGGDAWLGLLNELQNEYKDPNDHESTSLPGHARHAGKKSDLDTLPSSAMNLNLDEDDSKKREPKAEHSELLFGFSAELEELVHLTMKNDEDVLTGTFFVSVQGVDDKEEDRMVVVDLKKGILMEIVIETGETHRKHSLDDITSVDILESPDCWHIDLVHTEHKELRRHTDFHMTSSHSPENFRHVANYRMRSMKDAAELFVLLYKFVSDSFNMRSPEKLNPVLLQTPQQTTTNDVTSVYDNPVGLLPDLCDQYLNSKFCCPVESELTESARHTVETGTESAQLILWVSCLPYALPEYEFPVCLVLTNLNIYLFNLVNFDVPPKSVEQMEKVLPLMCCALLAELSSVVRGVFDLTFRLEFSKRGPRGTFTFLTRDSEVTESFLNVLEEVTMSNGEVPSMRTYDITDTSESEIDKLKREIALSCWKTFKDDECVLVYAVVRELTEIASSTDSHVTNTSTTRSLVLTNWNLFLCEEDHIHWPLPSYVRDAPSTPQWVVTKHDDVTHVIGIEVYDVTGECAFMGTSGMSLLLEHARHARDEVVSRGTEVWNVIFKLREEREQFQRSLSQIWSHNFHGELQTTKSKPICAKSIRHSPRVDVTTQLFQEGFSSRNDDPKASAGKGHRRNASGQFYPVLNDDSARESMQVLRNANGEVLAKFFNETLRDRSSNDCSETLVSYAWTGCVPYTYPTREVHVWLVLSSSKIYIVTDLKDRTFMGAVEDVMFETGTELCFHWLALTSLRQVCVGFFDQTFRLETDNPENTFTFITRDYQVTSCFLENLKSALKEIGPELPAKSTSADHSPSIYDSSSEVDNAHPSLEKFHFSKGVVQFLYPNDDTVEILKHSILEYAKTSEYFKSLNDISILLYLLMFQLIEGKKFSRTFMILDHALCTCVENHVNFPLPLFVKGLPMGSRYDIQRLRLITDIKRIEFSGFNARDFTIVYKKERLPSMTEEIEKPGECGVSGIVQKSACRNEEERWTMIAQTYEEKEKALGMILRFWKENFGEDLPVLKI